MTLTTPGRARARDVSMRTIRACGSAARRIRPWSIRGSSRSWRKRVRPVTFSAPSFFGVGRPMTLRSLTRGGASRERADPQPLVEQAGPLGQRGRAPHLEEGRAEHLHEAGVVEHGPDAVLPVDGRELRVPVERREVLRVEHDHRNRLEGLAVPLVQELRHQVGVRRIRLRPRAAAVRLAVAREDTKVATEVLARSARALPSEVLGRGREPHVLLERHSLREPLGAHHFTGSLCSPKTFFIAWAISPNVAYALTASMMAGMRLVEPRASSPSRRSAEATTPPSRSRRTRASFVTCASATLGSKRYSSTS